MDSDEELFYQFQRGDTQALGVLVQRHHRPLQAHLYRLVGNAHTAEDLVQEAFIRVVREEQSYSYPRPFWPWLYTIARRLALTELASAYHRHTDLRSEVPEPAQQEPDVAEWIERWDQRHGLQQALAHLSIEQREILSLRFGQELSVNEIATMLGIPAGTVKSRTFTSLRLLREYMQKTEIKDDRHRGGEKHG